ncbi:MAG TPA: glycosyltransferase [Gemmatimonadales bacterium]|nr:glycosyltransferase [Gemmatimonadales bacterium]
MHPFDIVHIAQTQFPDDARPRREALVAAATGARVAVIALQDGLDPRPVGHYQGVAIIRLPGRRRRGSLGKYVLEYTAFLARAHALVRRDPRFRHSRVIHVHTLPDFLVAAARPARRLGARVILDLHEIFPEFTRTKLGPRLGPLAAPVATSVERWSRRFADVTLTVNREIEALLASRRARPDERIVVIHNLTNPADLGPEAMTDGVVESTLRLAYHGTLTPMYGLDLAVDAVAAARAEGIDVSYDIFGSGPMTTALEQQIARLALGPAVRLHGAVSHHALRCALPTYHAGFLPTRLDRMTQYSLSTKLLEYVHLGIPLIAPRIPTYLRYFPEGCATYFTPGDAADAARAIRHFRGMSAEARVAQARAAQHAIAGLTWPAEAARLQAIYEELLDDGKAAGASRVKRRGRN